jgi:hypothetical protein
LPTSGSGSFSLTTSGGTSAPLAWNVVNPNLSTLYDVAFDGATGNLLVATNTQILRIDATSGQTLATFSLPGGSSGNTGLQVLPAGMTLAGVSIPSGSLLVTNGGASFDKIFALNPSSGAILATLDLGQNIDPVAGVFDPLSGSLFILDGSPNQVDQLNPATGAVLSSFPAPFAVNYGGLALDPVTGNLWIGSSQTNSVAEVTTAGILVRTVDLTSQSINDEISGLAFNATGQLLASSNHGVVYVLDLPTPLLAAGQPDTAGADIPIVSDADLRPLIAAAIARWAAAGVRSDVLAELESVRVGIADLAGETLAETSGKAITIDSDAGGFGWFVDTSPSDDTEFTSGPDGILHATSTNPAANRMDLLTVIEHELGHVFGLEDLDPLDHAGELMAAMLEAGTRRMPTPKDVDAVYLTGSWDDLS